MCLCVVRQGPKGCGFVRFRIHFFCERSRFKDSKMARIREYRVAKSRGFGVIVEEEVEILDLPMIPGP